MAQGSDLVLQFCHRTVRQSAATSSLPAYNTEAVSGPEHLQSLSNTLGAYCALLRETANKIDEIGDEPSADFFNQLIVDAEEELYFLESHLEAGNVQ